jgi:hypothetical protein
MTAKIFTPADIIWFKNVTNDEKREAYLDLTENIFSLHFPKRHKANVLKPAINEIILIYQKVNDIPAFTHLVTPVDNELVTVDSNPDFCYARQVKIIAMADKNNLIRASTTLFDRVNLGGITQGNACKLENVSTIRTLGNIEELQVDIWQRFSGYFVPAEFPETATAAILSELEITNPELAATEGRQKLVSHIVKERNPKIVNEKKQQAIKNNNLKCKACSFSFSATYDTNFIECHHIIPIGQAGVRETKLEDLALVCANCHRMLHKKFDGQYLSISQLQERIKAVGLKKDPEA